MRLPISSICRRWSRPAIRQGGHLALWLAARSKLPAASPLRTANPIKIDHVVSLGGLPDLEEAARPPGSGCGTEVIGRLTGGRFADTSVPRLAPLGVRQVLVNGLQDRIIPTAYAEAMPPRPAKGDDVASAVDRTGHVEADRPESAAWAADGRGARACAGGRSELSRARFDRDAGAV
jgi:hypothetical protein